jgi:hypothetical protein
MPLSEAQELAEHERRMDQMAVNIEKMRADMAAQQKQLEWETRKFFIQILTALGAAAGGGSALTVLILHWTGRL